VNSLGTSDTAGTVATWMLRMLENTISLWWSNECVICFWVSDYILLYCPTLFFSFYISDHLFLICPNLFLHFYFSGHILLFYSKFLACSCISQWFKTFIQGVQDYSETFLCLQVLLFNPTKYNTSYDSLFPET
jgi:hypothetical protein